MQTLFRRLLKTSLARLLDDMSLERNLVWLNATFVFTRTIIYALIPFYYWTIGFYMQFLDPAILRYDLGRGLWELHMQPPLFNLFLGLVLKLGSDQVAKTVFIVLYFLMGLILVNASFVLIRALSGSTSLAWAGSLALMFFPALVRAERWLFYPYPLAVLLIAGAWCTYKLEETYRLRYFLGLCAAAVGLVLMRSMFHALVFLVPLLGLFLIWAQYQHRSRFKAFALVASAAFLLGSSIYIRNYVNYGVFQGSTWQGMNLAEVTHYVSQDEKRRMVQQGLISPLALEPNLSSPDVYNRYYHQKPAAGDPALNAEFKTTGWANMNNIIFVRVSREAQKNAEIIVLYHPLAYLKSVANQTYLFFSFTPYHYFYEWRSWLFPRYDTVTHFVFDVLWLYLVPAFILPLFLLAVYGLLNPFVDRQAPLRLWWPNGEWPLLRSYLLFCIVYVFIVSNFFELKEGCFYRIPIDALLFIGASLTLLSTRSEPTADCPREGALLSQCTAD
jgi:hypothetical protein